MRTSQPQKRIVWSFQFTVPSTVVGEHWPITDGTESGIYFFNLVFDFLLSYVSSFSAGGAGGVDLGRVTPTTCLCRASCLYWIFVLTTLQAAPYPRHVIGVGFCCF